MTTTFSVSWSSSWEGTPGDNENINLGANRIREFKVAVHQRLAVDHSWAGDGNDGKHTKVQLQLSAADPPLDATDACLYTKQINGNSELFYEDSAARVLQLSSAGALNSPAAFVAGTKLLFSQAAAPVGWVQVTAYNDQVLRVVSDSSGGLSGGSWQISGFSASTVVAYHALTAAEIPAHTHTVSALTLAINTSTLGAGSPYATLGQGSITSDGGTGGNLGHTHGATTTMAFDGSWRPYYTNVIVCQKS